MQHSVARTVEFSQDDALKLAENGGSIHDGKQDAMIEKNAAQMRCGVSPFAVGKFRRVVFVGQIVLNHALEEVEHVFDQCPLKLSDEHGGGRVLGVYARETVTDA